MSAVFSAVQAIAYMAFPGPLLNILEPVAKTELPSST